MSGDYPFAAKIVSPAKCNEKPWDLWVSEIGHLSPRRDEEPVIRMSREELELEEILEIEKQMEELRRSEVNRIEQEAKKQKIREKEALIDELMFAEGDAKDILNTFAQNKVKMDVEVAPPVAKSGPQHQAKFEYQCKVLGVVVTASARSKKEAKQEVARIMLQQLFMMGHAVPAPFGMPAPKPDDVLTLITE